MKKEEIIKGNKIIAEFMGAKMIVTDYYGINIIKFPDESTKDLFALKYHCSWDWLMEAVEKCLIGEAECNEPVLITNIYDALTSISITGTFVAVVELIKWYNNQIE